MAGTFSAVTDGSCLVGDVISVARQGPGGVTWAPESRSVTFKLLLWRMLIEGSLLRLLRRGRQSQEFTHAL